EALTKISVAHSERIIELLTDMNAKLMDENGDAFAIIRDLMTKSFEDNHKRAIELREMDRSTEERRMMLKLLPSLANRVTGKEIFPTEAEDTALIEMLAENVSADHIKMLSGVLPAQVIGPLYARLEKYEKDKMARLAREAGRNG